MEGKFKQVGLAWCLYSKGEFGVAKVVEVNYVRSCSSTWPCFLKQYNKRKYIGIEFSEKFMAVKSKNKKVASSTIQDSGQTKFSDHLSSLFALECRHHLELAHLLGTRTPNSRILETKDDNTAKNFVQTFILLKWHACPIRHPLHNDKACQ